MSNGQHGGARAGAGRKSKLEKFETEINTAEKRIAKRLPKLIANLEKLADGGYERVSYVEKPAGLIYIEQPYIKNGVAQMDLQGRPIMIKQLAFPHLDPEQMVCVERSIEFADRDRAANTYLVDRVMGRPKQAIEGDLNLNDPDALIDRFEAAVTKVYGGEDGQ